MPRRFNDLAFTPHVAALQNARGSRKGYAYQIRDAPDVADELGAEEREFIEARDSIYLATVSETGWPYIQHRGGPIGFLRVVDARTFGFADFAGNKQDVSLGNLESSDRAALFLMDYPNQTRLKILAHVKVVERETDPELVARFAVPDYPGRVERAMIFTVEGFSWNCQQHITPRYTVDELAEHRPQGAV